MAVEYLLLDTCISVPDPARLVTARRDDFVALRIELDLRNLVLMSFEKCSACSCEYVVDAS